MEAATVTVSPHVLVIDDDHEIRELLARYLERQQFRVTAVRDAREARRVWPTMSFQLVVLDLMLPGEGGLEFARWLRSESDIPMVMLTALSDENDRIIGLELGADDYIAKPFNPRELLARMRAVLRRVRPGLAEVVVVHGDITLDRVAHRVKREGQEIHLGPTEFRLLDHLMRNPRRVFSREQLLDSVWGADIYVEARTVDVHVGRLRKALMQGGKPDPVRTVRSAGYSLDMES